MKQRGVIFTTDALGGILVMITLASIWVMMLQVEPSGAISQKQKFAQDTVLVALYNQTEYNHELNVDKETIVCKKYFFYDNAFNDGVGDPLEGKQYCQGEHG